MTNRRITLCSSYPRFLLYRDRGTAAARAFRRTTPALTVGGHLINHVFIITLENKGYDETFGNTRRHLISPMI